MRKLGWDAVRVSDPLIIVLAVVAVAAWAAFVVAERRAAEPIIPLRLFRSRTFVLATLLSLIVIGLAMFAVVSYMPTYLRMVFGTSATEAGLLLITMVAGLIATVTASGALMARTGRYKVFSIVGTAVLAVVAALMSRMTVDTPLWQVCLYLVAVGAGVGLMMQTLVTRRPECLPGPRGWHRHLGQQLLPGGRRHPGHRGRRRRVRRSPLRPPRRRSRGPAGARGRQ